VTSQFATSYATALAAYVDDPTEQRLKAAYDLGRAAVEQGLSILEVAEAHTAAVTEVAGRTNDVGALIEASGAFLIESLAIFEVVQRGTNEAWHAAWEERRRARLVRELSALLSDTPSGGNESVQELARLVAEMLREITEADEARVSFQSSRGRVEVTAVEPEVDPREETGRGEAGGGERTAITAPVRSIDGTDRGHIALCRPADAPFRGDDYAMVRQVADLAAAWLDRTSAGERA